jgi:hypothetical protein
MRPLGRDEDHVDVHGLETLFKFDARLQLEILEALKPCLKPG